MTAPTRNYQWRHWLFGLVVLLLVSCLETACVTSKDPRVIATSTETPVNRIERGLMDATDLPFGWRRESTGVPQDLVGGIMARYRDYRGSVNTPIFVRAGQSIALYASVGESEAAFQRATAEMFPAGYEDQWPHPPELNFTTHADVIRVGCSDGVFNGIPVHTCRIVARYDKLVTTLRGQVFEDRWLTMEQFRHLLERVDAKMEKIREPRADSAPTSEP